MFRNKTETVDFFSVDDIKPLDDSKSLLEGHIANAGKTIAELEIYIGKLTDEISQRQEKLRQARISFDALQVAYASMKHGMEKPTEQKTMPEANTKPLSEKDKRFIKTKMDNV